MDRNHAIFLINLVQDVSIVRPLVFLAARDLGLQTGFLVSKAFFQHDSLGIWQNELDEIGNSTGTPVMVYDNDREALQLLNCKSGALIAGSESSLTNHRQTHDIFCYAPSSLVKITLQHGFECVGFHQSIDHDLAHGSKVTFAADIICGWCDGSQLQSLAESQRSKLYVSGPPAVLQTCTNSMRTREPDAMGIICENLHSIRFNVAGDFKFDFVETFSGFCAAVAQDGQSVALRPHPAGQYMLKSQAELPANMVLNNNPTYKVDFSKYAYGISAPSSVLIDMMLAKIPVAVWRDELGIMDASNYDGLRVVKSLKDWLDSSQEAVAEPGKFLERQQEFLDRSKMLMDPRQVHARFADLLRAAARLPQTAVNAGFEKDRVLFIANAHLPTLHIYWIDPLSRPVEAGEMATEILTEQQIRNKYGDQSGDRIVRYFLNKRLALFRPTILVFCRYSGPHGDYLLDWARRAKVPVIYHIDDDLLNVPVEHGAAKHKFHNDPLRLAAVRYLLAEADLVYCSTDALEKRLKSLGITTSMRTGKMSSSGRVLVPARLRPVRKVGLMASPDRDHDLRPVIPALVSFLRRNPNVEFEIFGSNPKPGELDEFGDRVKQTPPIADYETFMKEFAKRQWDIGICPLADLQFNRFKSNLKWIEYTAVVASRGTVYDACCAGGCGVLAETNDEWLAALEKLTRDPEEAFKLVNRAQKNNATRV